MTDFDALAAAPYVSLATFRKSGARVATPMWCARCEDYLYAFCAPHAGKVKRLRNSSRAELAICNFKGDVTGEWVEAIATFVHDRDEIRSALASLRRKYGLQMHLADLGARLIGRFPKRVYIRLELVGPHAATDEP